MEKAMSNGHIRPTQKDWTINLSSNTYALLSYDFANVIP